MNIRTIRLCFACLGLVLVAVLIATSDGCRPDDVPTIPAPAVYPRIERDTLPLPQEVFADGFENGLVGWK